MQRIMSSSRMLSNAIVRRGRKKLVQNISVRGNVLIRENLHQCLACGGIKKLVRRRDGSFKLSGLFPRSQPYPHKPECTQKHTI